ncbi:MAG: hypothetical protein LWX83_12285 [Anaerolineae bacterium]|nr:hypothetical protein [Anaerolineae bacterium]
MLKEQLVERLLETENLTDELEDSEANLLIGWAIKQIDFILAESGNENEIRSRVNNLTDVMRKINRLVSQRSHISNLDWKNNLAELNSLFTGMYVRADARGHQPDADFNKSREILPSLTANELLSFLLKWPDWSTPS